MDINKFTFSETKKTRKLIKNLEELKIVFDNLPVLPHVEEIIRKESLLNSSIFSARIEGNKLTAKDYDLTENGDIQKVEIFNLVSAYTYLKSRKISKKVNSPTIKKLHKFVMKNLSSRAGKFRIEPWAIFDSGGNVIHLAPSYYELDELIYRYLEYVNGSKNHPLIVSAVAQFIFEKIHPFADGNGRVGRLVSSLIMKNSGYDYKGLISFEEYIDNNREMYYYSLEPSHQMTKFIEFFLESLETQIRKMLESLRTRNFNEESVDLSPRRKEILNTVKDHPYCSFDFIQRRFNKINPKTLHYDLGCLIKFKKITKIGISRGVTYLAGSHPSR